MAAVPTGPALSSRGTVDVACTTVDSGAARSRALEVVTGGADAVVVAATGAAVPRTPGPATVGATEAGALARGLDAGAGSAGDRGATGWKKSWVTHQVPSRSTAPMPTTPNRASRRLSRWWGLAMSTR